MKNIFKSLLSIVAAVVLTLSLASCITAQSKLQFTAFPDAEYYVGEMDEEAFLEEVKVSVDGTNYSLKDLKNNNAIISGINLDELGSHTLVVTYNGSTITFQYDVVLGNEVDLDGDPYETLAEALEEANKKPEEAHTIKLLKNINSKVSYTIDKEADIALDLNGFKLYHVSEYKGGSNFITNKGNLTIVGEGGSIVFMSKYPDIDWGTEGYPGYACNTIRNEGTLYVNGDVVIENQTPRGGASYVVDNYSQSKLVVLKGTLLQSGGDVAIRTFASKGSNINVEIKGGVVSGRRAIWVQLAGSNFENKPVVNVNISGGELKATQYTVYVYSYGDSHEGVTLNISGGELSCAEGQYTIAYATKDTEGREDVPTLNVTGGTFDKNGYNWITNEEIILK